MSSLTAKHQMKIFYFFLSSNVHEVFYSLVLSSVPPPLRFYLSILVIYLSILVMAVPQKALAVPSLLLCK